MPLSAYFCEQGIEDGAGLVAIVAEDVALLHLVGPFLAGQRRLVEGDVADEIEGVVVAADLLGELVEEHALGGQLLDDDLLLVGVVPGGEEVVERGVGLAHGLAGVVLERLGDELAVGVEVLDALGGDADLDIVDVVAFDGRVGPVVVGHGRTDRRCCLPAGLLLAWSAGHRRVGRRLVGPGS